MQRVILPLFIAFYSFNAYSQLNEETRQIYCANNRSEITRLQKLIPELQKSRKKSMPAKDMEEARDDYNLVISDIKKLVNDFHPRKAANKGTDKEYLLSFLDLEFDFEEYYTGSEQLVQEVNKDFDQKGMMIGSQPFHTIKRLRTIRDSIGRKLDRKDIGSVSQQNLDKQIKDANYMLSYHKNRIIELKCDEKTEVVKNESPALITPAETPKPSVIELKETTAKYGTFTITMKNVKDDIYEGVYNNNTKGVFTLRSYKDNVFTLQRTLGSTVIYHGRINGNTVTGTLTSGGISGTFTATLK